MKTAQLLIKMKCEYEETDDNIILYLPENILEDQIVEAELI